MTVLYKKGLVVFCIFVGLLSLGLAQGGFTYVSFKKDPSKRLAIANATRHMVKRLGECTKKCILDTKCVSFNFENKLSTGLADIICELLNTDKYFSSTLLKDDESFDYFYPQNKCLKSPPCHSTSSCRPLYDQDDYYCACPINRSGKHCETVLTPCQYTVCQNGGTCSEIDSTRAYCSCPPGWTGSRCEVPRPCDLVTCQHGGTCTSSGSTATCNCIRGWTGTYCNECKSGKVTTNVGCCAFPFSFDWRDYHACTTDGSNIFTPYFWCSFQHNYVNNDAHWGHC
ncbi:neurogenic locus notch homolog protein 1 [Nematostella vectensis]|uniref:neurogenic locus notch homolog protein 1 n=1 Tax=Nematostella vectensis TaxID=45351 RepID=UPI00138FC596|nr:neurogenic locus notch homolog protein 1 [Nematostella vectensis]